MRALPMRPLPMHADIEDITTKTGNFKKFSVFCKMLLSAVKQVRRGDRGEGEVQLAASCLSGRLPEQT